MSFDCLLGITDICTVYDKADGCGAYDYCDYGMDGGSICVVDHCGIDQTQSLNWIKVRSCYEAYPPCWLK